MLLLKIINQKIIIHYHNKGVATRQSKWFDNLLYKIFFKNIKVILLAENLYQDIKKYVKYKDVYICPNGIPVNPNLPTTIKKEFNILFLSNMMKEKGVWDLVESCRILKINGRSVKCHFVGKWSDITKEKFAAEINKRGLKEYVSAYGAKYNDEKDTFLQKADVFVYSGAGMEHWVDRVLNSLTNENLMVVEASNCIALRTNSSDEDEEHDNHDNHDEHDEHNESEEHEFSDHEDHDHSEGEDHADHDHDHDSKSTGLFHFHTSDSGHSHSHDGGLDPHVWLNPEYAKKEMENIKNAFVSADPKNKDFYEANYEKYAVEFDKLDEDFHNTIEALPNREIVVAHEAYGYLCDAYGLTQVGIEGLTPDSEPTPQRRRDCGWK